MAKVTNAFIKSKMNQDLDARLLPNGEYREGLNVQVSKSEGPDVGALENVLGNELLGAVDLKAVTGIDDIKVIGYCVDKSTDTVFLFLTDYTDEEFLNNKVTLTYSNTANNFVYSFNVNTNDLVKLLEGAFLNFSTTHPIIGVNILEDILFFTDNRNQPRKINVKKSQGYYTNEDQISVAKYNPYQPIELYKHQDAIGAVGTTMIDATSENLPDGTTPNPYYNDNYAGDPDFLKDKFVRFSYRFKFDDGEYSLLAPFTQEAFIPEQDGYFLGTIAGKPFTSTDEQDTYRSTTVSFMENKADEIQLLIPLPFEQIEYVDNVAKFSGLKVLELDIIYKESDGLAVQVVDTITIDEINSTMFSTVAAESYDSNGNLSSNLQWFYQYTYQGRKPYKTLPESELIRVYDKVPVRAFSQEVSGNRVIYGNFQDKHTPPIHLNYNVAVTEKFPLSISEAGVPKNKSGYRTSVVEYPMHSVKQNRNYQVGVVLSDKFGRSSTVILSSVNQPSADLGKFYGSTTYHPYFDKARYQSDRINTWLGDSIKLVFNDQISPLKPSNISGWPGIYNGNPNDVNYNPLGWYSYKIVVKQTEQEYYNVYTGGILEGDPNAATTAGNPVGTTSTVSLISDNINKVPKDVTDIGPEQKQFRSEVTLFPRVTPNYDATGSGAVPTFNEPFFPTSKGADVPALAEYRDIFLDANGDPIKPLTDLYESTTNPLVARLSTSKAGEAYSSTVLGSYPLKLATSYPYFLGVLETNPVVSRLEIFYETSTTGLINDLNYLVVNSSNDVPLFLGGGSFDLREDDVIGSVVSGNFYPQAVNPSTGQIDPIVNSILNSWDVFNPANQSVKEYFDVIYVPVGGSVPVDGAFTNPITTLPYDSYHIVTKKEFVYTSTSGFQDYFEFVFNFSSQATPDASADFTDIQGGLLNVPPTILADDGDPNTDLPDVININISEQLVYQFNGVNGTISNADGDKQLGLEWSISAGNEDNDFAIDSSGALITTNDSVGGTFDLVILLKDAGGQDSHTIQIVADVLTNDDGVPTYETINDDVWCMVAKNTINFINYVNEVGVGVPIAKNQQSSGFFWVSDPSNVQQNEPFDRSAGILNPLPGTISDDGDLVHAPMQSEICAPNAFNLFSQGFTFSNANFTSKSKIAPPVQGSGSGFNFGFSVELPYIAPQTTPGGETTNVPNPNDFATTNLQNGTMFIQVSHGSGSLGNYNDYCLEGFSGNSMAKLGVPIALEYRENPGDSWQTAIDVEGRECLFGGTQQASVQPRLTFSDTYANSGVILNQDNSDLEIPDPDYSILPNEIVSQVNFQLWQANDTPPRDEFTNPTDATFFGPGPQAEKVTTFVVGKDQSYFSDSKFGDYRLLIRYPFGTFPAPVSTNENCGDNTAGFLTPLPTDCNQVVKNPITKGYRAPSVRLSYGDFYNPVGVDRACMESSGYYDLQNPISYSYLISEINRDTEKDATYDEPSLQVYAREWHCRYVTRFYEDESCTVLLNFNGYRSYSPIGSPVVGKVDVEEFGDFIQAGTMDVVFGFNRSDNSHAHGVGEEIIVSPRDTEDNRRWVANFENGKKIKGSATPSEFISKDSSIQVREIVYSGGKEIKTTENLPTNTTVYEKIISGSYILTPGQIPNAPTKIGVTIEKGSKGAPIINQSSTIYAGTTVGYRCTIGSRDVAKTVLAIDSVGTIEIESQAYSNPYNPADCPPTSAIGGGCPECTANEGTSIQYSSNRPYNPSQTAFSPVVVKVNGVEVPNSERAIKGFLEVLPGTYSYTLKQTVTKGNEPGIGGGLVYATSKIFEL
jgi:hypothetical protein